MEPVDREPLPDTLQRQDRLLQQDGKEVNFAYFDNIAGRCITYGYNMTMQGLVEFSESHAGYPHHLKYPYVINGKVYNPKSVAKEPKIDIWNII